jgi:NAD(P)-dependent dehydrogenase (short-subunit alcohol dehydrogenase family)
MKRLQDRVAFITGGGSGIGRAIAERFAAEGARVAISGRTKAKLDATVKAIEGAGGKARAYALDVRDVAAIEPVVAQIAKDFGALHVLVNNAGISGPTPLETVTYEQWRDIIATNLDGAYFCARAALAQMKDHADCRVINIATIGAVVPFPGWTAYCASKSGLVGVTRCLAMEVAPRGITVNAILPGWVESDMQDAGVKHIAKAMGKTVDEAMPIILSQVPLGRMSEADEIAALAVHIASHEGRGMTGSSTVVSNGAFMN